ncbi:MAG TPA: cation:proton antiporter [Acidimicrobiales bacterium]|jgi:sodium/hydrogen antiporter|nr:cation:proton antiporter [Acidimicrobiales bacterium]
MDHYHLLLAIVGAVTLGASVLPLLVAGRPLSFPMVYVALGAVVFSLPLDLPRADPIAHGGFVERLSELVVIVALMGTGLKLDRPFGWATWRSTWRLLAVAMPVTIVATGLLGWWILGFAPATAMLLGAVVAPTDPVLASDVQVGPPGEDDEDEVRFALTSEAGLNDGLAFPFTNAAIAAASAAGVGEWVGWWFLDDVVVKLVVGLAMGVALGRGLGWIVFHIPTERKLAESSEGFVALAGTLLVYGVTELAQGYGFLAVFVAACMIRSRERGHAYHEVLHTTAENTERLLTVVLLALLGGAVVDGVLSGLGWGGAVVGLVTVLVLRPLAGLVSLARTGTAPGERTAIAFFGVRGIGSIYYLAHALEQSTFAEAPTLWAVVAFIVLLSVVLHGITAFPVMRRLDDQRTARQGPP